MSESMKSVVDYHHQAVMSPCALLIAAIYQHRAFNVELHCGLRAEGEAAYFDMVSAMDAPTGGVSIAKAQQADSLLTDYLSVLSNTEEEELSLFHADSSVKGFGETEVLAAVRLLMLLLVRASRNVKGEKKKQAAPLYSPQSIHLSYFHQSKPTVPSMSHQLVTALSQWMAAMLCGLSSV